MLQIESLGRAHDYKLFVFSSLRSPRFTTKFWSYSSIFSGMKLHFHFSLLLYWSCVLVSSLKGPSLEDPLSSKDTGVKLAVTNWSFIDEG